MPIDLGAVGKKLGSVTHSYTQRDVMLYALGVGCGTDDLRFTYERDLKVLPTFAVIPSFPAMLNLGGAMQVNPVMVLHGEQAIEVPAPIPTEGTVITTPSIKAVYDKGKGAVVVVGTESVDEKGKVLFRATSSIFVRGEGGFGGDRGTSTAVVLPDRAPDAATTYTVTPQQALLYRLCGDRNPLHADPAFAEAAGFPAPILHGLCSYGIVLREVVDLLLDRDAAAVAGFTARFAGVVFPGETIGVRAWREDGQVLVSAAIADGERAGSPVLADCVLTPA
jgi:acyl dehydratase